MKEEPFKLSSSYISKPFASEKTTFGYDKPLAPKPIVNNKTKNNLILKNGNHRTIKNPVFLAY